MDSSLLTCGNCCTKYDLDENPAKILPCACVMCLSCLQTKKSADFDEYVIKCHTCLKTHTLPNISSLLTSKIISHLLKNQPAAPLIESVEETTNHPFPLRTFSEVLAQQIKEQNAETIKHFDTVLMDIDNRAERIIQVKRTYL